MSKNQTNYTNNELRNINSVKRLFDEVWNNKKTELISEFFTDDFIAHYHHEDIKGLVTWKRRFLNILLRSVPDIFIEIKDISADGDIVISRWVAKGTHKHQLLGVPPSGNFIEFTGMSWMKFSGSKILENWNNWSLDYMFRNLLTELDMLKDILPICSYCKKIRNDKGYWEKVEVYIKKSSGANISHGICPKCMKEHFPKEYDEIHTRK